MKKRSGEAQAAQHRPPAVFKHRLTPRGGARIDPEIAEGEDVCVKCGANKTEGPSEDLCCCSGV